MTIKFIHYSIIEKRIHYRISKRSHLNRDAKAVLGAKHVDSRYIPDVQPFEKQSGNVKSGPSEISAYEPQPAIYPMWRSRAAAFLLEMISTE